EFDATHCPDLIPAISILAVFGDSVSKIKGAKRLIHKESNRAEALKNELTKLGVNISLKNDYLIIQANKNLKPAVLDSYNDHRLVMAFSILEIFSQGKIYVNDKNCVKKSYPNYFEDLKKLL
ncbi:MAG: 3-phosphoshikimate 1-carboxyvinyltransferase, partial [Bacteroidales bacterium]